MLRLFKSIIILSIWGLLAVSFLGFGGKYSRWLDHFAHFRVQYFGIGVLLMLYFVFQKRWFLSFLALFVVAFNGYLVKSIFDTSQKGKKTEYDFRVFHANILYKNKDFSLLTAQINQLNPDFISINEGTPEFEAYFQRHFSRSYHYLFKTSAKDNTFVMLAAKQPMTANVVVVKNTQGIILAETQIKGKSLRLIACHAYNPTRLQIDFLTRNRQLNKIAEIAKENTKPTLVVGDLNITPWSVFYQRMLTHSGLSNCRDGFGWQPTWHY
ncbi:MAG: endonuclease/exonuclease/phosphatase family protein, partial [Runella sp.]